MSTSSLCTGFWPKKKTRFGGLNPFNSGDSTVEPLGSTERRVTKKNPYLGDLRFQSWVGCIKGLSSVIWGINHIQNKAFIRGLDLNNWARTFENVQFSKVIHFPRILQGPPFYNIYRPPSFVRYMPSLFLISLSFIN